MDRLTNLREQGLTIVFDGEREAVVVDGPPALVQAAMSRIQSLSAELAIERTRESGSCCDLCASTPGCVATYWGQRLCRRCAQAVGRHGGTLDEFDAWPAVDLASLESVTGKSRSQHGE